MEIYVKTANKDLNQSLLQEQLEAAGLSEHGLLYAVFKRSPRRELYRPLPARAVIGRRTQGNSEITDEADPGELRFKFPNPLTPAQESTLDDILSAHDHTQQSVSQQRRQADRDGIATMVANFNNWDSMTPPQKDRHHKLVARLVARSLDLGTDV